MKLYGPDDGPLYQGKTWNRTKIIQHCIEKYSYESYLEIGYGNPRTTPYINWHEISSPTLHTKRCVDPWQVRYGPAPDFIIKLTSEEFFRNNTEKFDIIFIDGDHRAETVYDDIISSLKILNPGGVVLSHDNCPRSRKEDSPEQFGDGWKALAFLRKRSDLDICVVNADCGVSMIKKRENSNILHAKECDWCGLHNFLSDKEPDFSKIDYHMLENKRVNLLNLIEIDSALSWL